MTCTHHVSKRQFLLLCAAAAAIGAAAVARAEPKYVGWTKVEASREIRELKEKLREGGQVDDNARQFLEETALPQLALQENRPLIERTRKRLRELLLGDVGEDKAYTDIAQLIADFMTAAARDDASDPVVRVNAMLLVGELKAKSGKPWAAAGPSLAAAAGDKNLPDAVRIAALAGVAKHVAAGAGDDSLAKTFGPPVAAILGEPVAGPRSVEQEWLVSRALQLIPALVRPAPPKLAAFLAAIVGDEAQAIDLRVRAAAALGATADTASGIDAAAVVEAIRKLAITTLESEEQAAAARRFEERYRRGGAVPGGPQAPAFGGPPGLGFDGQPVPTIDPLAISEQACRRAAWRLYTLGTAIFSADDKPGLATLMGDAAGPAKDLAKQLTSEGLTLDSDPVEDALLDALDVLRPPAPGAKRPTRQPKPEEPAGDEQKPAPDPNASPFDNPFQ
jgi:hypothetical protein